jgi:translation initiation factor 1
MNIDNFSGFDNKSAGISTQSVPEITTVPQKIHVRIQQRTGRKSWTFIEGLDSFNTNNDADFMKRTCIKFRSVFSCSVTLKENNILQLQGDKRDDICEYLLKNKFAKKDDIVRHGF